MRKVVLSMMAALVLSVGAESFLTLEASAEENEQTEEITLTEEQQEEMSALQKEALEQQRTIINKYVEFGVFTEEKGDKIIKHFEKGYEELESTGFIPKWKQPHHKKES
ncbi:DUF2680 domain-containing protein [Salipaludibacillus agaradhaerens]|jgi:hypothetical protein|uniref:DUF2680 domain-containing protein n=1 Tax=Salipaludibacillus agaradhaerens TaxID=76935 RepID=A0A9Q4G002_SALAG|nr:DUF2680 domain-containing protein [Salipaludibacillus agaradhaerens]MCR6097592.1 DUF2680 domain-containing protein [Salipaludibacillus agaradhaerens]MCR6112924.1 DUF2680 domain-containing protein [Salipaludibacillus agaradhaerens]UJW56787.1 DUF2680 domain-containing protein [Bacillus sp. A116_S68]